MNNGKKACTKCKQEKLFVEFNKNQYHCRACHKILHRDYYLRTRPPLTRKLIAEQNKIKREELRKHRKFVREQIKAHRKDFRNQIRLSIGRKWRNRNKDNIIAGDKKYKKLHKERIYLANIIRNKLHRKRYAYRKKRRYKNDPDYRKKISIEGKDYRNKNILLLREKASKRQKETVKNLADGYVKKLLLYDCNSIKNIKIPNEIVELHRLNLILKRTKNEYLKRGILKC